MREGASHVLHLVTHPLELGEHRVDHASVLLEASAPGVGNLVGPDLSDIGKKYSRAQILESILEPSKSIDPKYVTYLVETTDGKVHTGLLAEKNEREVILKTVGDQEIRLPVARVAVLAPQRNSLMPELLLRDLTAEQAADLLAFLASLK